MLQAIFETVSYQLFLIGVLVKESYSYHWLFSKSWTSYFNSHRPGVPINSHVYPYSTVTHFSRKRQCSSLLICISLWCSWLFSCSLLWGVPVCTFTNKPCGQCDLLDRIGGLLRCVYGVLALVTRMADQLLGTRAASLRAKLHVSKIRFKPSHCGWFSFNIFWKEL